eukprot:scaffold1289_cov178-Amphora_coffeaeformis.AAC.1
MDYLRQVKKTKDRTPKEFLWLVRASETLACQLPDAPNNPGFSDLERRQNFFQEMPLDWQAKFIEANMRVEDESLNDMHIYFERLQSLYPYNKRNNDNNQGDNGQGTQSNRNARCNNNQNRRSRRDGGNRSQSNNQNNDNRDRGTRSNGANNSRCIQASDPCPLPGHGNHTWGEF